MSNLKGWVNPSWDINLANVPTGLTSTNGVRGGSKDSCQFHTLQKIVFCCVPHIVRNKLLSYLEKKKKSLALLWENQSGSVCIIPHESTLVFICGCLITKTRSLIKIGLVMCISFKENHRNSICDSLPS